MEPVHRPISHRPPGSSRRHKGVPEAGIPPEAAREPHILPGRPKTRQEAPEAAREPPQKRTPTISSSLSLSLYIYIYIYIYIYKQLIFDLLLDSLTTIGKCPWRI